MTLEGLIGGNDEHLPGDFWFWSLDDSAPQGAEEWLQEIVNGSFLLTGDFPDEGGVVVYTFTGRMYPDIDHLLTPLTISAVVEVYDATEFSMNFGEDYASVMANTVDENDETAFHPATGIIHFGGCLIGSGLALNFPQRDNTIIFIDEVPYDLSVQGGVSIPIVGAEDKPFQIFPKTLDEGSQGSGAMLLFGFDGGGWPERGPSLGWTYSANGHYCLEEGMPVHYIYVDISLVPECNPGDENCTEGIACIPLNNDDDNENETADLGESPVEDENDLIRFKVTINSKLFDPDCSVAYLFGTMTLDVPDNVKLWKDPEKNEAIPSDAVWCDPRPWDPETYYENNCLGYWEFVNYGGQIYGTNCTQEPNINKCPPNNPLF